MRILKFILRILKRLIYLFVIFTLSSYFLCYTTLGLKILTAITVPFIPGHLVIGNIQGSLLSEITVKNLQYTDDKFSVSIAIAHFTWDTKKLWEKSIALTNFAAENVKIKTIFATSTSNYISAKNSKNSFSPSSLAWLNYFSIKQTNIKNLAIDIQGQTINVGRLTQHQRDAMNHLSLETLNGNMQAAFRVDWAKLAWKLNVTATNLDTAKLIQEWPGTLNFNLSSSGDWEQTKILTFTLQNIRGQLRTYPVTGYAAIAYQNGELQIDKSALTIANAHAEINGSFKKNWDLQWMVNIPTLATIASHSKGSIISEGKIMGSAINPQVEVNVSATDIIWENFTAKSIYASINSKLMTKFTQTNSLEQPISAQIKIAFTNLNNIITTPYVKKSSGQIEGQINLSGKLIAPQLSLHAILRNGQTYIPKLGITLSAINAESHYTANKPLKFTGDFVSGRGQAKFAGQLDFNATGLPLELSLEGQNLTAMNSREYKIDISPNIKLSYLNNYANINGKIFIPFTKIKTKDYSNVTKLPNEVVFVNQTQTSDTSSMPTNLDMNIDVILGDDVTISVENLRAQLKGNLQITQNVGSPPTATGELHTIKGKYEAYGKSLTIKEGRLIYAGNIISNPGLDIRAIQKFKRISVASGESQFVADTQLNSTYTGREAVTVGIWIKGSLNQPNIAFFSDPAGMKQTDILSYLVFGYPQANIKGASNLEILNQLASTMNGNAASFSKKVKKTLGLSELKFGSTEYFDPSTNTVNNTATVQIGKRIGKKLSVHYSVGLFRSLSILNLKYQISKRLAIQTETSSLDNGADLVYEFERD